MCGGRQPLGLRGHRSGGRHPVGSVPFSHADWRAHFGPAWPGLQRAKRTYDPRGILVPGQGIFPAR
ncbi:hypothetical protein AB5J55_39985 [Streptomyces sp. R11]|uniref:Cytokinin dehydrogenase 1 FAD/cytokinin binding domain-containing protein n=1 Tax=Streptomyces sp. R11 TaxID=3238625 RepID=A0AB39NDQ7_9ACTN